MKAVNQSIGEEKFFLAINRRQRNQRDLVNNRMNIHRGQTKIIAFNQSQRKKHNELIRKQDRNI